MGTGLICGTIQRAAQEGDRIGGVFESLRVSVMAKLSSCTFSNCREKSRKNKTGRNGSKRERESPGSLTSFHQAFSRQVVLAEVKLKPAAGHKVRLKPLPQ